MMVDPILDAHELRPSCLDLTGRFVPASIRDQMLRSHLVVQRLNERKGLRGSRMLVVGMGASGVTAAIQAAGFGCAVTLIDKSPTPFSAQRADCSRWIDPTLYDWPVDHWTVGRFPLTPDSKFSLQWQNGPASEVQAFWLYQLRKAERQYKDNLRTVNSTEFHHVFPKRPGKKFRVGTSDKIVNNQRYDHLFFCHGFGSEIDMLGQYVGTPFWGQSVQHRAWSKEAGNILVVGGGDGALQDFLLAVTGKKSARDLLDSIVPAAAQARIGGAIQSAEDQAHRSLLWSRSSRSRDDHLIYERLEHAHGEIVTRILEVAGVRGALDGGVLPGRRVTIAHPCSHFSNAYALNRFLSLLILQHFRDSGRITRRMGVHLCDADAAGALAAFVSASCGLGNGTVREILETDALVLRVGQKRPPRIPVMYMSGRKRFLTPSNPVRQSLPYYLSA